MNDGVCDISNNIQACNYDAMDCCLEEEGGNCPLVNQCDMNLLRNGKCDFATNTSRCLYDLGSCLPQQIDNDGSIVVDGSMLCTESLYNDTICDFENFLAACNFDNGDCQHEIGNSIILSIISQR